MAAALALVAAFLFALAATLQQKGALNLPTISLAQPMSLVRLVGQTTWLIGTLALFAGYLFQAGALDRGRLSVIQPLLVSTVVFALPLGYFLTSQHVGRREVSARSRSSSGSACSSTSATRPAGTRTRPTPSGRSRSACSSLLCVLLLVFGSGGGLSRKAAVYGTVAGVLFGLSSSLAMPTLDYLHESVGTMLSHWECYALAVAGVLGFVLQQVSLGTGRLAPSVATVSVANPVVAILIGIVLLDERLSRPAWHVVVAVIGLGLALVGAVVISLAREAATDPDQPRTRRTRPSRQRSRDGAHGPTGPARRVIHAGAEVLFYGLAAAASALVLSATFVVIRSERPRTNGIAFLSGFLFGTVIACGLGLALGQAAVDRLDSHETLEGGADAPPRPRADRRRAPGTARRAATGGARQSCDGDPRRARQRRPGRGVLHGRAPRLRRAEAARAHVPRHGVGQRGRSRVTSSDFTLVVVYVADRHGRSSRCRSASWSSRATAPP